MLPKAVLFDMDGTIVHSEPLWMRCETEFVLAHGGQWSPQRAMELVGNSLEKSGRILSEAVHGAVAGPDIIAELVARMIELYRTLPEVPWRPGFLECATGLAQAGVKLAVVSASYSPLVGAVVERIPNGLVETYVGGDQVEHDKPHPEPYLLAAEKLSVPITDCLVVEDSQTGIAAGLASGAHTIGVPCVKPIPAQPGLSRLRSLAELTPQLAQRLRAGELVDTVLSDTWAEAGLVH